MLCLRRRTDGRAIWHEENWCVDRSDDHPICADVIGGWIEHSSYIPYAYLYWISFCYSFLCVNCKADPRKERPEPNLAASSYYTSPTRILNTRSSIPKERERTMEKEKERVSPNLSLFFLHLFLSLLPDRRHRRYLCRRSLTRSHRRSCITSYYQEEKV